MSSTPEPHPVGRHLLGPHVVGQRVVVRHVLRGETGPTGGPALTDVLGVCLAWGDGARRGRARSTRSDGPVRIRSPTSCPASRCRRDPRCGTASPRATSSCTRSRCGPTWSTEPLGEWVLRCAPAHDGRLRRRANSALAMGDPGRRARRWRAGAVQAWHRDRDREPMVMAVAGSEVESGLLDLGWRDLGSGVDAHCQVAGVAGALRALRRHVTRSPRADDGALRRGGRPGGGRAR